MPLSASQRATELAGSLDSLIALQKAQIAEWETAGKPPSYSVDGESYSWGSWLAEIDAAITAKIEQRQRVGGAWIARSRGRV